MTREEMKRAVERVMASEERLTRVYDRFLAPKKPPPLITLADLRVQDPQTLEIVPLTLNPVQRALFEEIGIDPDDPCPNIQGRMWRLRILKARRTGITTAIFALYFLDTYNHPERLTVSLAHDLDSAEEIFQLPHRFYRYLPPEKKRRAARANVRELYWPDINSRMVVTTANKQNAFSGATITNLHKSERAKWQGTENDIRELDASLNIAARWGNIVEETTAQGLNFFYKDWQDSQRGGQYRPLFFPWWQDPRNRSKVPANFVRTEREEERAQAHNLTDEQLQWYREATEENREKTPQEYPDSPAEAFLSTSNARFNRPYLYRLLETISRPEMAPERVERASSSSWHGDVKTYVAPERDARYLLVADTAFGLTQGGDPDYSVCHVYSLDRWEQVCHYRGRMAEHDFAKDIRSLGLKYNNAMVVVETPGPGETVLSHLIHSEKYNNIYYFVDELKMEGGFSSMRAGYPMNARTKPQADADLASLIEAAARGEPSILFRDPNTVEELIHYVRLSGATCGAEGGGHDDEVACARLAAALLPLFGARRHAPPLPEARPTLRYSAGGRIRGR